MTGMVPSTVPGIATTLPPGISTIAPGVTTPVGLCNPSFILLLSFTGLFSFAATMASYRPT